MNEMERWEKKAMEWKGEGEGNGFRGGEWRERREEKG